MADLITDYIPDRNHFVEQIVPRLPFPPISEDVCDYLSIPPDRLKTLHEDFESGTQNDDLMAQWNRLQPDPTSAEEVARVYEQSEFGYILEQAFYDRFSYGKYLRCREHVVGNRLLDYGTALGNLALYFHVLDGLHVTAADLQSPHFQLAKHRFKKHAPDIQPLVIDPTKPPRGNWHTIVSMDVLEHVPNWQQVLAAFGESQTVGNRIILKIGFGHPPDESLHITDENDFTPEAFRSFVRDRGYRLVYEEEDRFFVGEKMSVQ